jgi:hypothetical protein
MANTAVATLMEAAFNLKSLPAQLMKHSAVLRELADGDEDGNVGALFDYNPHRIQHALTFVKTGEIIPSALSVLARLQLRPATPAARKRMLRLPGEPIPNEFQLLREVIHQELMLRPAKDARRAALWAACQTQSLLLLWSQEREKYEQERDADAWWDVRQALVVKDASPKVATHLALLCAERGALASLCLWVRWGGVDPSAADNQALRKAARNGHLGVVQYLCALPLVRGVDPGAADNKALRWAAAGGYLPVVQYLCALPPARGVDPGAPDNEVLWEAARYGHLPVVQYLCALPPARGVDPGANDNAALRWAAEHGHLPVVQYLCALPPACGVDPGALHNDALQGAAANGHLDVVQFLCALPLARGVDPGANDNDALKWAALHEYLDIVQYLCALDPARGVDPSARHNDALQ